MDMEELSGSNDHTNMIMMMKGKRTKRQRPLSPAGRVTSSSSSGGGGGGSEISTSTEEDEDMANCLILLAQGGSCSIKQEEEEIKTEKFSSSSRRLNEMVTTTTAAKAGLYVYECKTCNRTFPSFQALGGHRASHKKPKPTTVEEKKVVVGTISVDQLQEEEEEGEENRRQFSKPNDPISSQSMELSNKATSHGNNKSKIHECSICGSEFSSGQALGGHMRRHRNPTTSAKATVDTNSIIDHSEAEKPSSTIFPLDLNLPAPEDHDHRDLKLQYVANQQHLVFSAPALVDCHY